MKQIKKKARDLKPGDWLIESVDGATLEIKKVTRLRHSVTLEFTPSGMVPVASMGIPSNNTVEVMVNE